MKLLTLLLLFTPLIAITDSLFKESSKESKRASLNDFLLTAQAEGIISSSQLIKLQKLADKPGQLLDDVVPKEESVRASAITDSPPGVFMKLYNRLTLLNVLYFGGALLVMGAATLFMTLAWERFSGISLFFLIVAMSACAGTAGVILWKMEEYEMVGGIMCCISVSLVPFAVYSLERGMGWWPKRQDPGVFQEFRVYIRPGWVLMEVATVIVGLIYVYFVRFPFLLAPVSFSLWFLSMDLAPLLPQYTDSLYQTRRWVSVLFGLFTMIAGYGAELVLGSHPDFGFWLYLFGIIPFWFSLMLEFPNQELLHSIQLTVNACLLLSGSQLDRMMFEWFGIIGMGISTGGIFYAKTSQSLFLWMLKALIASALLSESVKTVAPLVVLGAIVSVTAYNINAAKFYQRDEVYFLLQLFTNLGYLISLTKFYTPCFVEIWFISFDLRNLFAFICSVGVACFHVHLFLSSKYDYYFLCYRLVMSILLSLSMLLLSQELFVCAGLAGIPCFVWHMIYENRNVQNPPLPGLIFLLVTAIFGVAFSSTLHSQLIYYVCSLSCAALLMILYAKHPHIGLLTVMILLILSIPLQSKCILTICVLYLFIYLTWLAYEVFKNSLMFPVALVAIGLVIIFLAINYQQNENFIDETFDGITPAFVRTFMSDYTHWEFIKNYKISSSQSSTAMYRAIDYMLWSSAAMQGFVKLSGPMVVVLAMTVIVLLILMYIITITLESFDNKSTGSIEVDSFEISPGGEEYENHGLIISVSGTKSKDLPQPSYLQLTIEGYSFWQCVEQHFGSFKVSLARSIFLPYKLTPGLVEFIDFQKGSTSFQLTVYLATGKNKSRRVSAVTLKRVLDQLRRSSSFQCVIRFSTAWYKPYQRLCSIDTSFGEIYSKYIIENTNTSSVGPRQKRNDRKKKYM